MKIEDLDEIENESETAIVGGFDCNYDYYGNHRNSNQDRMMIARVDAKRALVGAGARILFYPTLLYNVFRNKMNQAEFRWWDQIDQVQL